MFLIVEVTVVREGGGGGIFYQRNSPIFIFLFPTPFVVCRRVLWILNSTCSTIMRKVQKPFLLEISSLIESNSSQKLFLKKMDDIIS